MAQEDVKQKAKDNAEVIVVSGTPGGAGIRKIDASFAVTNIDASDIEKLAPKSTADLFKAIPGVWLKAQAVSLVRTLYSWFPGWRRCPVLNYCA